MNKYTLHMGQIIREYHLSAKTISAALGQTEENISRRKCSGDCFKIEEAMKLIRYIERENKEIIEYLEEAVACSL